jgi:O-antigen/teichoic acid export membrane protein
MASFTRDTLLLMTAQGIFTLTGYALNVFLARYFGPEIYGVYGAVMAVLVWVELFVINGVPTAMQKFLPESAAAAASLFRLGRRLQGGYTLIVFLAFVALAPALSGWLHEPSFKNFFWIAAPDIVIYGLYWFYLGTHNGLQRFKSQALVVSCYAICKLLGSIGLVLAGAGITGAFIGNFLGSTGGLIIGMWMLKTRRLATAASEPAYSSQITKFALPIILYTLSIGLILNADIVFVKRFLPPDAAGHYTAAATIARVPYFIFLGLTSTVLPALSRMLAHENPGASRQLLRQTMRLLFGLLIPALVLVMANAADIVAFLYTTTYDPATPILRLLIVGVAMYTLLVVGCTILSAAGYPNLVFHISLGAAVVDVPLCLILVPKWGAQGAAMATLMAAALGALAASVHVLRKFNSILPWQSLLRAAMAGAVICGLSLLWRSAGLMLLLELILLFVLYLFVLYILGESKNIDKIL